jgi:hypothetical protein
MYLLDDLTQLHIACRCDLCAAVHYAPMHVALQDAGDRKDADLDAQAEQLEVLLRSFLRGKTCTRFRMWWWSTAVPTRHRGAGGVDASVARCAH